MHWLRLRVSGSRTFSRDPQSSAFWSTCRAHKETEAVRDGRENVKCECDLRVRRKDQML